MEVIKKLAPKYWLGYYIVYAVTLIIMTIRYGRLIAEGTDPERIFIAAAIFGVSTGVALTAAIASEGVGFLILLIPNRIREIKEEGSAEGFAKGSAEGFAKGNEEGFTKGREAGREEGRAEGREEGRAEALAEVEARVKAQSEKRDEEQAEAQSERRGEGVNGGNEGLLKTAIKAGREIGVEEANERIGNLLARYDRGEITFDELRATLANPINGNNGAD